MATKKKKYTQRNRRRRPRNTRKSRVDPFFLLSSIQSGSGPDMYTAQRPQGPIKPIQQLNCRTCQSQNRCDQPECLQCNSPYCDRGESSIGSQPTGSRQSFRSEPARSIPEFGSTQSLGSQPSLESQPSMGSDTWHDALTLSESQSSLGSQPTGSRQSFRSEPARSMPEFGSTQSLKSQSSLGSQPLGSRQSFRSEPARSMPEFGSTQSLESQPSMGSQPLGSRQSFRSEPARSMPEFGSTQSLESQPSMGSQPLGSRQSFRSEPARSMPEFGSTQSLKSQSSTGSRQSLPSQSSIATPIPESDGSVASLGSSRQSTDNSVQQQLEDCRSKLNHINNTLENFVLSFEQ
jgi:hypothetical protein